MKSRVMRLIATSSWAQEANGLCEYGVFRGRRVDTRPMKAGQLG
jgi:hypothetical protein